MSDKLTYCKVCGVNLFPFFPWGENGQFPSYDICPCCGIEFGYEDASEMGILTARKQWISSGMKWLDSTNKPKDWDSIKQSYGISNESELD